VLTHDKRDKNRDNAFRQRPHRLSPHRSNKQARLRVMFRRWTLACSSS